MFRCLREALLESSGLAVEVDREELVVNQGPGCPLLGAPTLVDGVQRAWGDSTCDGPVALLDALVVSRFVLALPVQQQPGCPPIGSQVVIG